MLMIPVFVSAVPLDEYEQQTLTEKIDGLDEIVVREVKIHFDQGLLYIEEKVDARLKWLPGTIGFMACIGVMVGSVLGYLITWLFLRNSQLRIMKVKSELRTELRLIRKELQGLKR